jgi:hypothetical protein
MSKIATAWERKEDDRAARSVPTVNKIKIKIKIKE